MMQILDNFLHQTVNKVGLNPTDLAMSKKESAKFIPPEKEREIKDQRWIKNPNFYVVYYVY